MRRWMGGVLAAMLVIPVAIQTSAQAACSWPLVIEADTVNLAYPDTNATYWLTRTAAVPGTRIRIDGTYPYARYFSFHAYDEQQRPVGGLADLETIPAPGTQNPFVDPVAFGGAYRAFVSFEGAPASPEPGTLYAGSGNDGEPNPVFTIIYRVYVPDVPGDLAGGVPLPDLTLETTDGDTVLPLHRCEAVPPQTGSPLTSAIRDSSFPDEVPRVLPWPPAQNPPLFVKFYSLLTNLIDRFPSNPLTDPLPRDTSGGFLSNVHINYLFALTARTHGDVFAMRALAPTAPDTRNGARPTDAADVRYWSVCQNNFVSQRFVQCLADFEVALDPGGTFTIVVSDPDDRPANAVNWLPWGGPYYDGNVIYRHMLPSDGFAGAIQNVSYGQDPAVVMGAYFPQAAYCDRATFETGGFDACAA